MSKLDIIDIAHKIAQTNDFSLLNLRVISEAKRENIRTLAQGIIDMGV